MWSAEYDRQDLVDIADQAATHEWGMACLSAVPYTDAVGRAMVIQRVYREEMRSRTGRDEWDTVGEDERRMRIHQWLMEVASHQPLRFADLMHGLDEEMAERAHRRPRP